jgi:DnaJ like chaperone protein
LQQEFFDTTFVMLGYIAKADGRVSETEIAQAEAMFAQLRLTPSQREGAIKRFKRGAEATFDPAPELTRFRRIVALRPQHLPNVDAVFGQYGSGRWPLGQG